MLVKICLYNRKLSIGIRICPILSPIQLLVSVKICIDNHKLSFGIGICLIQSLVSVKICLYIQYDGFVRVKWNLFVFKNRLKGQ
jgi:hypothetical protein